MGRDPNTDGLAKLNEISESFAESNKILLAMQNTVETNCAKIDTQAEEFLKGISKKIEEFQGEVKNMETENAETQGNLKKNIEDAKDNIKKERDGITTKEADIIEVINVLNRLKNLAQDELAGKYKLETEMKNYTIVNNHGVSFIQRSNFKQELKGIMANTEATGKSLISSLILMTSLDDGHYADPKSVQKILDVLDKIIKRNEEKKNNLQSDFVKNTKEYREMIENSLDLLENMKESAIKAEFNVSNNHKMMAMYNQDIAYLNKVTGRRVSSQKFKNEICAKQKALATANLKKYAASQQKIAEIKNAIA